MEACSLSLMAKALTEEYEQRRSRCEPCGVAVGKTEMRGKGAIGEEARQSKRGRSWNGTAEDER